MSNLQLTPLLLSISALTLFAAATPARAQLGGRDHDGARIIRSDPRVSSGAGTYPTPRGELYDPNRNRQRDAKRMAGSAVSEARKALKEDPPDYLKAKQLFAYAARLNPEDERAYVGLGDVNAAMRRYPEAISAYSKAVRINERSAEAHYGLALVYHAQGGEEAARDELQVLRSLKKKELVAKLEILLGQ